MVFTEWKRLYTLYKNQEINSGYVGTCLLPYKAIKTGCDELTRKVLVLLLKNNIIQKLNSEGIHIFEGDESMCWTGVYALVLVYVILKDTLTLSDQLVC